VRQAERLIGFLQSNYSDTKAHAELAISNKEVEGLMKCKMARVFELSVKKRAIVRILHVPMHM
jgi:hypothetical protein